MTLKKYIITCYIAFSVINTLILTCICYFTNNFLLFAGENFNQYLLAQKGCECLGLSKKIDYDDAIFINVSYGKELVLEQGEGTDDIVGSNVITDRRKLYKFLELLNKSQRYKYVLMDIMFDKDHITEYDDVLFSLLERMNKLVFVNHDSVRIACPMLKKKTAHAVSNTQTGEFVCDLIYKYIKQDRSR